MPAPMNDSERVSATVGRLPSPPNALLVYGDHLYATAHSELRFVKGKPFPADDGRGGIFRLPLDGHSAEATCLCPAYAPYLLHVDPLHVWIQMMGGVRRIPLGGGELALIAYYGASAAAIDDTRAFIVVPYAAFSIPSRAPLTGDEDDVTDVARGAIECIAIDERYVYTSERLEPHSRYNQAVRIMRRPKSGGEGFEVASFHERIVELQAARGMVLASVAGGPIYTLSRDGGPVHELADTFGNEHFAVEGASLFVCDVLARTVRELSLRGGAGRIVARLPQDTSPIAKAFTVAGGFAYFGEIRESYRERDHRVSRVRLMS